MIIANKHLGETPLEFLERLRKEKPELQNEKLSYAGRLDPVAEGQMLVLVGEENKNREKFLNLDKEYHATFLVGVKTDSGDVLGLIDDQKEINVSKDEVENKLKEIAKLKEQKYPWFSGKTINGVKLFEHFKEGRTDIERPTKKIQIKEINLVAFDNQNSKEIEKYILDSISKVKGDFRQKEIAKKWQEYFENKIGEMQTFEIKIKVSSGTFIRGLTENFGFPTALLRLNRTKIFF